MFDMNLSRREFYLLAACACFAVAAFISDATARETNQQLHWERARYAYELGKAHAVAGKKPCGCKGAAKSDAEAH